MRTMKGREHAWPLTTLTPSCRETLRLPYPSAENAQRLQHARKSTAALPPDQWFCKHGSVPRPGLCSWLSRHGVGASTSERLLPEEPRKTRLINARVGPRTVRP